MVTEILCQRQRLRGIYNKTYIDRWDDRETLEGKLDSVASELNSVVLDIDINLASMR